MARAGDVLENPATDDRLVFLRTAAETGGEVLEYELEFVPRGFGHHACYPEFSDGA